MKITFEIEITQEDIDHFWSKVSKSDGCWIWNGYRDRFGYGRHNIHNFKIFAHRFSYVITHGALNPQLVICHTCDNPPCVRPDHLFSGTLKDNTRDMIKKGRARFGNFDSTCPGNSRLWRGLQGQALALVTKLTDDQVREIRRLSSEGVSQRAIAKQFGIARSHAHRIIHRQRRIGVI